MCAKETILLTRNQQNTHNDYTISKSEKLSNNTYEKWTINSF